MKKKKVIKIPVNDKDFFKFFLKFTTPLHDLSPRERSFLSEILYKYSVEKKNFKNEADLWKKVFDYDTKVEYCENLNVKMFSILNLMTALRKKNIIQDNTINKNYMVDIENLTNFYLTFNFEWTKN